MAKFEGAPSTRRKTAVHLQAILYHAGPRTPKHRSAMRILDDVPYLERPPAKSGDPSEGFTLAEIAVLLRSVDRAPKTSRIPIADRPAWWRALILFAYHTALRIGNIRDARWSWIDADGWMHVPAKSYKQGRPGRQFYISRRAREIAESIRTDDDLIFGWQGTISWFHTCWRRIVAVLPPDRRFAFKGFRRRTLTWLGGHNPLVARLVAGHRKLDVLEDHYVSRSVVVDLLERLPRPDEQQLTLSS